MGKLFALLTSLAAVALVASCLALLAGLAVKWALAVWKSVLRKPPRGSGDPVLIIALFVLFAFAGGFAGWLTYDPADDPRAVEREAP